MRLAIPAICLFILMGSCGNPNGQQTIQSEGPFVEDWESLGRTNEEPGWFKDAKFGIYFHWGIYSVPAYGNEWYPRQMHVKGDDVYNHHLET
jgi:alpha-L-fucosidase